MKNERLDAALEYVRRGWEIFPATRMKTGYSIQSRGFDNGAPWGKTKDEAEVREYWRRLPNANIGLVMGIGSGIWDLEYDTPEAHGVDGAASLAKLEQWCGTLPVTLMFVSPSGSVHRLFQHPGADVRIRAGALDAKYPGIDVKGDGGMSLAPPE
jgi:bifunctional DNA primase/polymerase-like protein